MKLCLSHFLHRLGPAASASRGRVFPKGVHPFQKVRYVRQAQQVHRAASPSGRSYPHPCSGSSCAVCSYCGPASIIACAHCQCRCCSSTKRSAAAIASSTSSSLSADAASRSPWWSSWTRPNESRTLLAGYWWVILLIYYLDEGFDRERDGLWWSASVGHRSEPALRKSTAPGMKLPNLIPWISHRAHHFLSATCALEGSRGDLEGASEGEP